MRDNYRHPRRLLLSWLAAHICVNVVGQLCLMVSRGQAQIPINGLVAKYDLNGDAHNSDPGNAPNGHIVGAVPAPDRLGHANSSVACNGIPIYIEIPDSDVFSVSCTGELSISVWVRRDGTSLDNNGRLLFSKKESTGYVHWMGKG